MRLPIRSVVCWTGGKVRGGTKEGAAPGYKLRDECETNSPERKRNQKYPINPVDKDEIAKGHHHAASTYHILLYGLK